MPENVVEKEILGDIYHFLEPGVESTTSNGSVWKKIIKNKEDIIEAFSEEALEVLAGITVTALVSALTGGAILLPGALGFGTAVAMSSYKKMMSHDEKGVMKHVKSAPKVEGK